MITPLDVAEWMLAEVMREGTLDEQSIVADIASEFGKEYVVENEAGYSVIRPDVLAEFRQISEDTVVWMQGEKAWRKRNIGDEPGRRQD